MVDDMLTKPLITFLIPVYHVDSDDFSACLTSIRAQSIFQKTDCEILIVVDGGQENSEILGSPLIQRQDLRVVVQEHAGEAAARNRGIAEAKGKYLIFVDADDSLEPQAAEVLVHAAQVNNADAVFANHSRIVGNTAISVKHYATNGLFDSTGTLLKHVLSVGSDQGTVWAKLFDVEYLRSHGLQFKQTLVNGVDQEFMVRYALTEPAVAFISHDVYRYRYNADSVVRKYDPHYPDKVMRTIHEIEDDLKRHGIMADSIIQLYLCDRILLCLMNYVFNPAAKANLCARRRNFMRLVGEPEYSQALRNANFAELDLPRRIVLQLCRMRCFVLVWLITDLRHLEKRIQNKHTRR